MPPQIDPERRSRLLALKLHALVRDHLGGALPGDVQPLTLGATAALVHAGAGWVLAEDHPDRSLGPALAWAHRQGLDTLHVLAEHASGLLARRASYFAEPPTIWQVVVRDLVPAVAEPLPGSPALDPALAALEALIVAGGAEPVREHGVLAGEVAGLEVCRAVHDPTTGVARLEVGVGAHDREAFLMIHGDVPPVEALADVVTKVARHRTAGGGAPHPLRRLAAERLLRWQVVRDPAVVGARTLQAVAPPVPRPNVKDPVPCVASGEDVDGRPLVVVCSSGVDLDLVPFAADARAADGRAGARLVLAVPARDAVAITREMATRLLDPAEVLALADV